MQFLEKIKNQLQKLKKAKKEEAAKIRCCQTCFFDCLAFGQTRASTVTPTVAEAAAAVAALSTVVAAIPAPANL